MPARALTRLGASVFLTVLSLVSIILLLPGSNVSIKLQKIALGESIDNYGGLWDWVSGDDAVEGGARLVVFGDSWVDDTIEDSGSGKGRSWTEVLCEVVWMPSIPEIREAMLINATIDQLHLSYQFRGVTIHPSIPFVSTNWSHHVEQRICVVTGDLPYDT
jgi:hypothetical protein